MNMKLKYELGRALRNFRYERSPRGIVFQKQGICIGGVFTYQVDDGPKEGANNTLALECLDAMLTSFFTGVVPPTAFYIAPFTNNVAPTSSLTAATFAATQGEYTAYTAAARLQWVPDGASASQTIGNTVAPAQFTIGASAATVAGAGLLTASAKSATTGTLIAAALFATPNALNAGSKLSIEYSLSATAS